MPTNAAARRVNTVELDRLPDESTVYEAAITGRIPANKLRLPVPDPLELKVGAKILFVKNKKPKWINGDMGEIIGLEESHIRVKKHGSDSVLVIGREEWQKLRYTYDYQTQRIEKEVVGTFSQFPVTLGWAITIHKSQGMTRGVLTINDTDKHRAKKEKRIASIDKVSVWLAYAVNPIVWKVREGYLKEITQ